MLGLAVAFATKTAAAQGVPLTIDTRSPALTKAENGGWTVSLGFTNLTNAPIVLDAEPDAPDNGCDLTLAPSRVRVAEHLDVTVSVPAGCKVGTDGFDFTVSGAGQEFEVSAAPKPDPSEPEWDALYGFVGALVVAVVLVLIVAGLSDRGPRDELKYLDATWSFQDGWVSNITVIGGLLAGIFGSSDVVTALGADADQAVALATVGAAIAAVFIAAGPILLLSTKSKDDCVTVWGFLAASALTLTGAGGEIYVLWRSGADLDLNGWEDWTVILFVGAVVLLVAYALRTTSATIRLGTTEPDGQDSDAVAAAKMIVAALNAHASSVVDAIKAHGGVDSAQLAQVAVPEFKIEATPAAPPRRRRSAAL
jgi:hypothetical protein